MFSWNSLFSSCGVKFGEVWCRVRLEAQSKYFCNEYFFIKYLISISIFFILYEELCSGKVSKIMLVAYLSGNAEQRKCFLIYWRKMKHQDDALCSRCLMYIPVWIFELRIRSHKERKKKSRRIERRCEPVASLIWITHSPEVKLQMFTLAIAFD